MWEPGGTQSASPGGVQFGSRSNFAPTEPWVPCNLAFVSSGQPLFLGICVNDHLWYPLYFFRGNDHLWECISRNWNWPVAMVVQVALLAERLGAKRAQDLQSKVLGSIVAVKIPPGWESFSTELIKALPKTNITRELWMLSWDQSFKNTLRAIWISIESLCSCYYIYWTVIRPTTKTFGV